MRDDHLVEGKKQKVEDIDEAYELVKKVYTMRFVFKEGSLGSYHFFLGTGEIIAEAWIGRRGNYWWLRIKEK